jgi:hypothetical protein
VRGQKNQAGVGVSTLIERLRPKKDKPQANPLYGQRQTDPTIDQRINQATSFLDQSRQSFDEVELAFREELKPSRGRAQQQTLERLLDRFWTDSSKRTAAIIIYAAYCEELNSRTSPIKMLQALDDYWPKDLPKRKGDLRGRLDKDYQWTIKNWPIS